MNKKFYDIRTDRPQTLAEMTNDANNLLLSSVSSRTVRKRLRFHGFTRRKIPKTHTIRKENKNRRINWCRSKIGWTLDRNWKKVIFSGETQVVVDQNKGVFVWRRAA
jgi:hypothetical protein